MHLCWPPARYQDRWCLGLSNGHRSGPIAPMFRSYVGSAYWTTPCPNSCLWVCLMDTTLAPELPPSGCVLGLLIGPHLDATLAPELPASGCVLGLLIGPRPATRALRSGYLVGSMNTTLAPELPHSGCVLGLLIGAHPAPWAPSLGLFGRLN